jgi:orotidine-5'-phosphate decarboxylase
MKPSGASGWETMQKRRHIPATHFKIADAKLADIGNTSGMYARFLKPFHSMQLR